MKKLIIAAAALVITCAAYGQGTFVFNTHDASAGNTLSFTLNGVPANNTTGDMWLQVFGGPAGTAIDKLTPLTPLFAIGSGAKAGLTVPFSQILSIPGMASGSATIAYQAYQGSTLASATALSTLTGATSPVDLTPAGSAQPPNEVAVGTHTIAIVPVPEPTTLALGLIGLGTLLAFRRRS